MFHKYNSFTNSLTPTDQLSAYVPESLGTKETTNNFFVAPQPKGRQPGGSGPDSRGSLAGRRMTFLRFLTGKTTTSGTSPLLEKAQEVATNVSRNVASVTSTAANAAQNLASVASTASDAAQNVTQNLASVTSAASNAAQKVVQNASSVASNVAQKAVQSHGHHQHSHAAPWEGVNLWRTPYKGDTDTITQVKRNKGTLDQYVENRTRRIQQLQLFALRNKSTPTWVMMPRDKIIFAVEGVIAGYVLYSVVTSVYQHLKAKDRLKLLKLLYKDNVD